MTPLAVDPNRTARWYLLPLSMYGSASSMAIASVGKFEAALMTGMLVGSPTIWV